VPPLRHAAETGSELGGALGIAVLGSLGVAIYRHLMSQADLPPQAAGESGGTIGSASALARTLPATSGHSLMTAAAHAFTEAFAVMSGVSAAIIAVVAVVAFRPARSARIGPHSLPHRFIDMCLDINYLCIKVPGGAMITGFDHVQIAMPAGREDAARAFYAGLLGMAELPKPPVLAARGGCWFGSGAVVLHLGVEASFAAARKAHPALLVDDLDGLAAALTAAAYECIPADGEIPGIRRFHTHDPFGNRIEFQQA
jgi:catechol 2,3-dioxygenase-like lactoylglutathione lyase family enzyme